jgi:hypothetical protein
MNRHPARRQPVLSIQGTVTLKNGFLGLETMKDASVRINVSCSRSTLRKIAGKAPLYNISHYDKVLEEYIVLLLRKADCALEVQSIGLGKLPNPPRIRRYAGKRADTPTNARAIHVCWPRDRVTCQDTSMTGPEVEDWPLLKHVVGPAHTLTLDRHDSTKPTMSIMAGTWGSDHGEDQEGTHEVFPTRIDYRHGCLKKKYPEHYRNCSWTRHLWANILFRWWVRQCRLFNTLMTKCNLIVQVHTCGVNAIDARTTGFAG